MKKIKVGVIPAAGHGHRLNTLPLTRVLPKCLLPILNKPILEYVIENMQREIDSGITLRSQEEIDYTTFGELGEIVKSNWTSFGSMFSSQKAFTKIMTSLNTLRGPIAHCCPLAEDEVVRLQLTVRDWFRLME
jgi:molybdopterin-guanine dinucleotide biosynthesis protein A